MFQLPKRRKSLGTKPGLYDGCLRHSNPNSYNKVTVSCPVWGLTMSCWNRTSLQRSHGPFLHTDSFKFHTVAQHISALTVVSHSTNCTCSSPTEDRKTRVSSTTPYAKPKCIQVWCQATFLFLWISFQILLHHIPLWKSWPATSIITSITFPFSKKLPLCIVRMAHNLSPCTKQAANEFWL
jgi:hypothetical protein